MNVFDLDRSLVRDYERFARSFTQIRAPDIRSQIVDLYVTNRFWPEPLITINPHFLRGASIADLAAEGSLQSDTAKVFRVESQPIRLHRHQEQAVAKLTGLEDADQDDLTIGSNAAADLVRAGVAGGEEPYKMRRPIVGILKGPVWTLVKPPKVAVA